jgi:glycosyltransferase involved in cell wall biosynthesis
MRVLHVIARMNVGGTATYLANLVSGLEKSGVHSLLAIGHVPSGEEEDSVVDDLPVRRISRLSREISMLNDWKARKELLSVVEDFKPDLIHTHTFKAGALLRLGKVGCPIVHSFHGHHLYDPEFGFVKRSVLNVVERRLARKCSALITIGNRVRDELLAVGIGKADQYTSIAPGIEELRLGNRNEIRKRLGIVEDAKVVVWLGRFTKVKRPDRVVDVARALPEVVFVMAGGGELFEEIRRSAPKNLLLVGFQDKNEMWSIADIGLCTSDSEGMPLSLIEAQMAGVPVVSTDVGSVSEIVEAGVTGYLAPRDSQALVDGVKQLLSGNSLNTMGNAARARARSLFSAEVMVAVHIDLYKKVLGKVAR